MKWKLFSLMAATILVLTACNTNGNDNAADDGRDNDGNVEQTRYENDRDNMNNNDNDNRDNNGNMTNDDDYTRNTNNNNQYKLADEAADKITNKMDDIDHAYVLKTDNNAYVAAQLNRVNKDNNADMNDEDNKNMDGNTAQDGDDTNKNRNNRTDKGHKITDNVKNDISDIVKSVDSDVDNVYVTTNPDFFDLAGDYSDKAGNGKPVRGLFDQMGNMIERVFPQQGNK